MAISRRRWRARASSRFATVEHAMSSTNATITDREKAAEEVDRALGWGHNRLIERNHHHVASRVIIRELVFELHADRAKRSSGHHGGHAGLQACHHRRDPPARS